MYLHSRTSTDSSGRRTKISADPNNTNWAKSENNYGARLLAKSGWQPGQFLGAENANHADHYTAANASHIRVVLREDNAGLGAIKGKSNAETFGLSTLSGIFGRLNGKSEAEVQKQADTQRDLELQAYQSHKWGTMNFVYGGLLVGDKMEEKKKLEEATAKAAQSKRKAEDDAPVESLSKKRKHFSGKDSTAASESSDESEGGDKDDDEATKKKSKKQKKRSKKDESAAESTSDTAEKASKKDRKERRKKDKKSGDSDEKAQAKEEKRARKEERRKRKEEKRQRKEAKGKTSAQTSRDQSSDSSSDEDSQKPEESKAPAASFGGSRHAVRQRYIMQKRQAGMNPQAMAEILMLKATA